MAFCAFNVLLAERAWGRMGKASTNPPCSHQIYTKSAAEDDRTSSCCSSCSWWGCISHRWRFSLFFSCSKRILAEMLMWQIVVIMRCRWDLKVNLHPWWPHFSQELESCQDCVLDITILLLFINHLSESVSCKL